MHHHYNNLKLKNRSNKTYKQINNQHKLYNKVQTAALLYQ